MRGSGRRAASPCAGCGGPPLAIGREGEAGSDVVARQVREVPEDFLLVTALRSVQAVGETVLVQPARARRFAQAFGKLAKTDRVDATMLARLGRLEGMEATPPTAESLRKLKDLVLIRRRFVDERADLGKLASKLESKAGLRQVRLQLRCLAIRVAALDRDIRTAIGADAGLARRAEVLRSIPGVGPATVASLIANMPELGGLDRRAVAALLGTAPWANDSGKHQGRRHVRGGRAAPRRAMYMAALAAIRFNPRSATSTADSAKPARSTTSPSSRS